MEFADGRFVTYGTGHRRHTRQAEAERRGIVSPLAELLGRGDLRTEQRKAAIKPEANLVGDVGGKRGTQCNRHLIAVAGLVYIQIVLADDGAGSREYVPHAIGNVVF